MLFSFSRFSMIFHDAGNPDHSKTMYKDCYYIEYYALFEGIDHT